MRNIYVVGNSKGYANWMEGTLVSDMKDANLVVFTGGEDVHPSLYGETMNPTTSANLRRDIIERDEFNKALELKKPMVGICRGSQFLCVMSGGKLIQNQPNPAYRHEMHTHDGKTLPITSTHHQAAYPFVLEEEDYRVLAWGPSLAFHEGGPGEILHPPYDCEIVRYFKTNALGIQGHPEAMDHKSETITYLRDKLNKFLNGTV